MGGSYIWYFYAIVLADTFVRLLIAMTNALRDRASVKVYPATVVWQCFLLLLVLQVWVASASDRADTSENTFVDIVVFLLIPIGIVVLSALLDAGNKNQMKQFNQQRTWFFAILAALPACSILRQLFYGDLTINSDFYFQLVLLIAAPIGIFLRTRTADLIFALVMGAILIAYIAKDYSQLTT